MIMMCVYGIEQRAATWEGGGGWYPELGLIFVGTLKYINETYYLKSAFHCPRCRSRYRYPKLIPESQFV